MDHTLNDIHGDTHGDICRDIAKVLVANRGEIARRIFRTLREMGLETVAVFSDADDRATHVAEADEAVRLGPAPSRQSYLDQEAVLRAAEAVGADAIHPGYGFLAESAEFAERCEKAGLIFIGPSAEAIRTMGDKSKAKTLAAEVGLPVLEGFNLDGLSPDETQQRADDLGYPLLVKAAAGGGGKGMRVVSDASALPDALASAAREAEAAFGDGRLLIERWLSSPRHVEVQVLGDAQGHVIHLFERDCSVQRRHQKVFEESPCPAVDPELRRRLGDAAVRLAKAVSYCGAGTVEFLLDAGGAFYFLEMNTRLQVEHPVTEAVTGLDLVRLQVEIAQGCPLGLKQEHLEPSGHAIEARLYAEDPGHDFLPATGPVVLWSEPDLPGLRIDSGVEVGDEVSVHYDPMMAKVIAHGRDRSEALRRLHRGLSELAVAGPTTNREFLLAVLEHEAFRVGRVDTGFVEQHLVTSARLRAPDPAILELHAIAATLHLVLSRRQQPSVVPGGIPSGWRNNHWRAQEQAFEHDQGSITVAYTVFREAGSGDERFSMDVSTQAGDAQGDHDQAGDDQGTKPSRQARLVATTPGTMTVEVDGVRRRFQVGGSTDGHGTGRQHLWIHGLGRISRLTVVPRFADRQSSVVVGGCVAPMTGKVIDVRVAAGDRVSAGEALVILEAMKMEHQLSAHTEGVVEAVDVEVGQMVDPDQVLVVVRPIEADGEAR